MRLFVTEKPQLSKNISEILLKNGDCIFSNNSFKYKFDFNNYQQFSTPKYQFESKDFLYKVNQYTEDGKMIISGDFSPDNFVSNYDISKITEILIATDPDHAGVRSADFTLDIFSKDFLETTPVNFIKIDYLSDNSIQKAYIKRASYFKDNLVLKGRKCYQLKDYLDYNFMGLVKIGKNEYNYLTRNMVWILLALKDNTQPLKEYDIFEKMHKNKIGSAASISSIYKKILEENLIDTKGALTSHGVNFLEKLNLNEHSFTEFKNINDLVYSDVSLEQGKISIEIFLKNLFKL